MGSYQPAKATATTAAATPQPEHVPEHAPPTGGSAPTRTKHGPKKNAHLEDGWGAKKEAGDRPEKESRQEAANQGEKTGREKIGQEKISREKIRGEEEAVIQTRIARSVLIAYFSS